MAHLWEKCSLYGSIFAILFVIVSASDDVGVFRFASEIQIPSQTDPELNHQGLEITLPQNVNNHESEHGHKYWINSRNITDFENHTRGFVFFNRAYAKPPVGKLSFAKTQPLSRDEYRQIMNNRPYRKFGNYCPQHSPNATYYNSQGMNMSQDCLNLNIFTPRQDLNKVRPTYPVYVLFHGGALCVGSSADFGVAGLMRNFVSKGVIVVTVNYRLGMYGFHKFDSDEEGNSVRGIYDMQTALKWVHDNIRDFGGDPTRITLGGHSAGACMASIMTLAAMKEENKELQLFQNVIIQSGSTNTCRHFGTGKRVYDKDIREKFCQRLDISLDECLASLSPEQIQEINKIAQYRIEMVLPDGKFKMPDVMLAEADSRSKFNVLIGQVKDEFALIDQAVIQPQNYGQKYVELIMEKLYPPGSRTHEAIEAINDLVKLYFEDSSEKNEQQMYYASMNFFNVATFTYDIVQDARTIASLNHNVYAYEWAYHGSIQKGMTKYPVAIHGSENYYLYMPEQHWANYLRNETSPEEVAQEIAVSDLMVKEWVSFIKTGKPLTSAGVITETAFPYVVYKGTQVDLREDGSLISDEVEQRWTVLRNAKPGVGSLPSFIYM